MGRGGGVLAGHPCHCICTNASRGLKASAEIVDKQPVESPLTSAKIYSISDGSSVPDDISVKYSKANRSRKKRVLYTMQKYPTGYKLVELLLPIFGYYRAKLA